MRFTILAAETPQCLPIACSPHRRACWKEGKPSGLFVAVNPGPAGLPLLHQKSLLVFFFWRQGENSCVGFGDGILMVTEDTQKLCCDLAVFWGQLTPLSGAAKQAGCWRRREPTGTCEWGLFRQIFSTFAKSCFGRLFMAFRNHFLVLSSFLPCEKKQVNVEGAWHELFL